MPPAFFYYDPPGKYSHEELMFSLFFLYPKIAFRQSILFINH
jgi:hypothetical protein